MTQRIQDLGKWEGNCDPRYRNAERALFVTCTEKKTVLTCQFGTSSWDCTARSCSALEHQKRRFIPSMVQCLSLLNYHVEEVQGGVCFCFLFLIFSFFYFFPFQGSAGGAAQDRPSGSQFTSFASTKVQVLTPEELRARF
jgi:cellulose synthase/poly-beta-1,6-N-acetylglucosamine synthase-like glycosyltransferase